MRGANYSASQIKLLIMRKTNKEQPSAKENPEENKQEANLNPEEETQTGEGKEETPTDTPAKENPEEEATDEVDEVVDKVLRLYPQYESLYVDSKGFVFTEGTSKAMRGNAKLYKNKYFKK